ncbi:MAG: hypothetical protein KC442_12300 [Thermomicrobiales bacterium]|nr:hypothetical protein [Thermomicrobiales bacterium]
MMNNLRRGAVTRRALVMGAAALGVGLPLALGTRPAITAAQDDASPTPQPGGVLRFGVSREPSGFDPHIDTGFIDAALQGNVYDRLVEYSDTGEIVPALAESWEMPDDRTYIFHLRDGVTFHNGDPFTSADVIYTFDRILDENTGATLRSESQNMESYEAVDPLTVKIVTREPYASFLTILASNPMSIVSKAWAEAGGDFQQEMVGTGPFMLAEYEPEVRYVMPKNPNYWKPGLPYLDSLELIPTKDIAARISGLQSGQLDFVDNIPWQDMLMLGDNPDFAVHMGYVSFAVLRINPTLPPTDLQLVRQALNYAINRDDVSQAAYGGMALPMTGSLFPEGSFWYEPSLADRYAYDPDKAKVLLAEAGFADAGEVSLGLTTTSPDEGSIGDVALVVLQNLEDLGLNVDFEVVVDFQVVVDKRISGEYQLMADGLDWTTPDPDALSLYFQTGGSQYAAGVGYSNPELDALFEQGRVTPDQEARKAIYLQVQQIILDDAPWIFGVWRPEAEASRSVVHGYTRIADLGVYSVGYFENIWMSGE